MATIRELFEVHADHIDAMHLRCKKCSTDFWSDAYGENVTIADGVQHPCCPSCGATTAPAADPEEGTRP